MKNILTFVIFSFLAFPAFGTNDIVGSTVTGNSSASVTGSTISIRTTPNTSFGNLAHGDSAGKVVGTSAGIVQNNLTATVSGSDVGSNSAAGVSTVLKTKHDTVKNSINNVR